MRSATLMGAFRKNLFSDRDGPSTPKAFLNASGTLLKRWIEDFRDWYHQITGGTYEDHL